MFSSHSLLIHILHAEKPHMGQKKHPDSGTSEKPQSGHIIDLIFLLFIVITIKQLYSTYMFSILQAFFVFI